MPAPVRAARAKAKDARVRIRQGIALCLSGGGFRASLFHLGALRRLNEVGILGEFDEISSVSGGSIIAAHLAKRIEDWPAPGSSVRDWDAQVAAPFQEFASRNLRTLAILSKLLPWNWFDEDNGVHELAKRYRALHDGKLGDLPDRPRFTFCATDLVYGVNWEFSKQRVGSYRAGYIKGHESWTVALAVAASSCFPPVFSPLQIKVKPEQFRDATGEETADERRRNIADLRLSDGGLYDNLGLEPVVKEHGTVLVSDGGAPFDPKPDSGILARLGRYTSIQGRQVAALRKRMLHGEFNSVDRQGQPRLRGAYWAIDDYTALPEVVGYGRQLAEKRISAIRTDLDAFSMDEMKVLENQGYLACAESLANGQYMASINTSPIVAPYQDMLDESRAMRALTTSHKRRPLGRW